MYWGKGGLGNEGAIWGVPENRTTSPPTNFREQIAVYALYSDYRVVYVGQTGSGDQRLFRRLRAHRKDHLKDRWNSFSWFGLVPVNEKWRDLRLNFRIKPDVNDTLDHIEAILTAVCEPPLNLQRGRFGGAEQYIQHPDNRLSPKSTERAAQVVERLNSIDARLAKLVKA